ncbi:ABC transporter permease [Paludibacterium purpuratum]|uniref:ABC-2 type transport system permease protein n=1 Tax=Paludibacterium purpuratum TaxID=1144873 RepID=A0A4R7B7P8_9NEIS|nr:ABC transporter permease [Paludibacterium purpuratum]TDR79746.1 ABC-2 type transport system permease protein [Paludibacterium purpuratum]
MSGLSWRRLWALCRKESYQIVRDPSSVLIAFILPVLLLFIFGFGVSLDASRMRIGIVNEDANAESQAFAEALYGSPYIDAVHGHSRREMIEWLRAGKVRGVVVLAPDFARRLAAGNATAPVSLLTDGAEPNTANFVAAYVQGAWLVWQNERARATGGAVATPIELTPRYWFNPSTVSRNYLVPGSIAVIMTIIGALLTSLVVAREWERGTMEALLSTPVTKAELLLSKILPYYLLGVVSMLICLAVTVWVLGVPFHGSLAVLLAVTSLFLGSALGLGLLISTLTRNQFNAAQAALNAAFLPATMLSGFAFEIASMPAPVRAVTYLIPARYFVSALQTLFQAGQIWPVLWRQMAFLLVSALFWLGLTALKTSRRLD